MTTDIEREALQALEQQPWFGAGLRFTCTGCGKSCTGPAGAVYLSQADVDRLSEALQLPAETFVSTYTRVRDGQLALADQPDSSDCIFLEGKACSVYNARPTQCRAYPFWLVNVLEAEDWAAAAEDCEGINHADASLVTPSEIFEQCRRDIENESLSR